MTAISMDELVKRIGEIPTLPIISQKIMSLLNNDDVSVKEIAAVIEKDPALAVKILKIANSSFFGSISQISSIDYAIMRLGLGEVKAILHAFSIHNFFSENTPKGFDRTQFWKHSIICSQVARYLEHYFMLKKDDTLFLSGLIHDLGKIIFDQFFHDEFLKIIDYVRDNEETFSKAEKAVIGFTHYQVAAKLLQQWQFPKKVIMQVFFHHAPWNDNNFTTGSTIIYLANILTKLAGFACLPTEKTIDIEAFSNSNAVEFIIKNGFDLDQQSLRTLVSHIQEYIVEETDNILSFFN